MGSTERTAVCLALAVAVIVTSSVGTVAVAQGGEAIEKDASSEAGVEVTLAASPEILRPGDSFSAVVTVKNVGATDRDDLIVELSVSPEAVAISSVTTPDGVSATPSMSTGVTSWSIETISSGEPLAVSARGVVASSVVTLTEILVVVSVFEAGQLVAEAESLLLPIVSILRQVSIEPAGSGEVQGTLVGMSTQITSNAHLSNLIITETLTATKDHEPVVPVAIRRIEEAEVSPGRVEWTLPMVESGQLVQVAYKASYPLSLNVGDLEVTSAIGVRDSTSELFLSEKDLRISSPRLDIESHLYEDLTPDNPIKPGDSGRLDIVLKNDGSAAVQISVVVDVGDSPVTVTSPSDGGQPSEAGVTWSELSIPSNGDRTLTYGLDISRDVREDTMVEFSATVFIDGVAGPHEPVQIQVDTGRRQGSDTAQFFVLILLFILLGFGALFLFAGREKDIADRAANLAAVVAVLAAILILAFGLDLESETTLTLLGTIAGYVFGRGAAEARAKRIENTPLTGAGSGNNDGNDVAQDQPI